MAPDERRSPSARVDERRVEIGPPGFVGFYRIGLVGALVGASMALPMGLTGMFAAGFWSDFGVALRMLMGIAGAAATYVSIWLPIHVVTRATSWRTRIRVRPGGVFIESGSSTPRVTRWLTPRSGVTAGFRTDEAGLGGFVLSCGVRYIRVGIGHLPIDSQQALATLQLALAEVPEDASDTLAPAPEALGPGLGARLRALGHDLLRPLLRPTPYLLVDLGTMALTPLVSWLVTGMLDWRDAYPIAFGLFIAGLAARRLDGSYMAGMRHYLADDPFTGGWGFKYMLAGIAVAIAGWGAMAPRLGFGLAFGLAMVATIGLHRSLLRRALGDSPAPKPNRALDLALALTLVPICVLHEVGLLTFLVDSSRGLGPLTLCFVPPLVLVGYLPVRLHAFIDAPGDRSNIAWFWLTFAWLAMQPLLSIGPAITRAL
ncbi:MAG: hypothetical protein H0T76_21565 [Nannocystis sp.]|nr:hypothetical protein [Nannocystis sp.]MBA3549081.1 hypothetical protein [Nannocystis sp.]